MGRIKKAITLKEFQKLSKIPGLHAAGGASGLYVSVNSADSASWVFRYTFNGKRRDMGLGNIKYLSLVEARDKANELHRQIHRGIDPINEKHKARAANQKASTESITFKYCAIECHKSHGDGWSSDQYREQWLTALEQHVFPFIGNLNIADIDTDLVLSILTPIWKNRTVTASRIRQRIELVLDWATVRQYRTGENPARWKGNLETLLAKPSKVANIKHYPALPYKEIPEFMQQLRNHSGYGAAALEFTILTIARTKQTIGAVWAEIDLDGRVWTVPAIRMKNKKEHKVPLSNAAINVIHRMQEMRVSNYIFPGIKEDKPISKGLMRDVLSHMGRKDINGKDITVHGFRSTFRDWASETTEYPHEVCEMAMAHAIPNQVVKAYRRGNLFEKRKQLMDDWARYCYKIPTK